MRPLVFILFVLSSCAAPASISHKLLTLDGVKDGECWFDDDGNQECCKYDDNGCITTQCRSIGQESCGAWAIKARACD